jgi:hypothetical protein
MKVKFLGNIEDRKINLINKKEYDVVGIEADDYRIVDEKGEPYLFPYSAFVITDETIPNEWIISYGEDGEKYAYPPILNVKGFFEDFFDGNNEAMSIFRKHIHEKHNDSN